MSATENTAVPNRSEINAVGHPSSAQIVNVRTPAYSAFRVILLPGLLPDEPDRSIQSGADHGRRGELRDGLSDG